MYKKFLYMGIILLMVLLLPFVYNNFKNSNLPVVAIANYGPHASLDNSIKGFKQHLEENGFIEGKNIIYEIADVGFDPNLITQMIASLKSKKPKVMIVMTTPVAQAAKGKITDIPLVYNVITDPVAAGLIKEKFTPENNITGSSDMQDLKAFLQFAKSILPNAKRIGILYSTSESNDTALLKMMKESADFMGMEVVSVPIDNTGDILVRMKNFKDKVDFIYVGTSGPIQPALPAIAAEAAKMNIPIFNVESQAVVDGLALASFGVDYLAIGKNAGKLACAILRGQKIDNLKPIYPNPSDHYGVINQKLAKKFLVKISENVQVVG